MDPFESVIFIHPPMDNESSPVGALMPSAVTPTPVVRVELEKKGLDAPARFRTPVEVIRLREQIHGRRNSTR